MLQVVEDMRQKQHKIAASQGNSKLINIFELKNPNNNQTNKPKLKTQTTQMLGGLIAK